jgi:hypothetical protein
MLKQVLEMARWPTIPWLQELPDPISRVTWDNYLTMSPKQMQEQGFTACLERGDFMADVAEVTANGVTVKGSCLSVSWTEVRNSWPWQWAMVVLLLVRLVIMLG